MNNVQGVKGDASAMMTMMTMTTAMVENTDADFASGRWSIIMDVIAFVHLTSPILLWMIAIF